MGILQTQLQGLGLLQPPSPGGSGPTPDGAGSARSGDGGGGGGGGGRSSRGGGASLVSPSFPDSHTASRAASQNLDAGETARGGSASNSITVPSSFAGAP